MHVGCHIANVCKCSDMACLISCAVLSVDTAMFNCDPMHALNDRTKGYK